MPSPLPKVTIAIIGGGLIGPRHAQSVIKSPNATLIALVDPAPHGSALAAELKTSYHTSVEALINSPHKPQAAIVCTPNATHVEIGKQLASASIDLLIEKPVSTDIPSGRALIAHAHACNVKLLIGHHRRFHPTIALTKSILTSSPSPPSSPSSPSSPSAALSLGTPLAISGLWTTLKPPSYFLPPASWRRTPSAGAILINLIHEIDILQHLFGRIARVHAEPTLSTRGFPAEEGAAIVLRFASGVVGTFVVCDAVPSPFSWEAGTGENPMIPRARGPGAGGCYRIFGTRACLSVPDMVRFAYEDGEAEGEEGWTRVVRERRLEVQEGEEEEVVPFDRQLEYFVQLVRGQGEDGPGCGGEDGLRALLVCEAVREAMRTGEAVEVEDV